MMVLYREEAHLFAFELDLSATNSDDAIKWKFETKTNIDKINKNIL